MKLMSSIILFLLTFTCILRYTDGQTNNESFRKYSYHVVGVIGNKAEVGGTGFFVKKDSNYYFISAWHSFSFKDPITKTFTNEKAHLIQDIIVYRKLSDIAIDNYERVKLFDNKNGVPTFSSINYEGVLLDISAIKINRENIFKFDFYNIDINKDNIEELTGDSVFYFGFPIRNARQVDSSEYFKGTIIGTDDKKKEFTIDIVGYIGCSGAPLFIDRRKKNNLIGVLFYALKDNTGKANVCKAVDIKILLKTL